MTNSPSALWPAHLHHFSLRTAQLDQMAEWYSGHLELEVRQLAGGRVWLAGGERNLVLEAHTGHNLGFVAYALAEAGQVEKLDAELAAKSVSRSDVVSPVFGDAQISVVDPDGNVFVFGVPLDGITSKPDRLPGRLQHVGIATPNIDRLRSFYVDVLGYRPSDIVKNDDGAVSACFLRCDHEHHALALFAASSARFDHQCYETSCWNDIRDWGDHAAARRTEIEWGAARHGAGNNLFIFIRDPDGIPVEFSAELEERSYDSAPGEWKTEARTLNLWGTAWERT